MSIPDVKLSTIFRVACPVVVSLFLSALTASDCRADGIVIDKVYLPYVQPMEWELEYRLLRPVSGADGDLNRVDTFGIGKGITDRFFAEISVSFADGHPQSVDSIELEAIVQLSEQGQYAFDWGMLLEIERDRLASVTELSAGVIVSREWDRWVGTANLLVLHEHGDAIDNEMESLARIQAKYRYKQVLEPAIEVHLGEDTQAIGPIISGALRQNPGHTFRWQLGVLVGLDAATPDQTIKVLLEYEFW